MNTTIHEQTFPNQLRCATDGSVAGTTFYDDTTKDQMAPAGVTVQQEGLSIVRVRFAAHYAIGSFVMGPGDTRTVNMEHDG